MKIESDAEPQKLASKKMLHANLESPYLVLTAFTNRKCPPQSEKIQYTATVLIPNGGTFAKFSVPFNRIS